MADLDRAGIFRAIITDYGIRQADSGAVAVSIQATLLEYWMDTHEWEDWRQFEPMEAYGDVWVVGKEGQVLKSQTESLVNHCGWDGTFTSISDKTWQPTKCQVEVKAETYKDVTRYKIAFINGYDRTPGQIGRVDPAKAKELQMKFGQQLKAISGAAKNNGSKPAGKPAAPPAPATSKANTALQEAAAAAGDDDIPFVWLAPLLAFCGSLGSIIC